MVKASGRRRVAVIGTGISGLSAAWMLKDSVDLAVFEADNRVGGHSYTIDVGDGESRTPVDVGFIVYNEAAYPNLTALFQHLGVGTQSTDMSLAVSLDDGRMEYAGGTFSQLWAQRRNVVRPRFWMMIRDIVRFYRQATKDIDGLERSGVPLGVFLDKHGYSQAFREDHLLPMAAAIWSIPTAQVLDYPAHAFIRFHDNHGLLKLANRPLWRTVVGGSRSYVEKLSADFRDQIRCNARVVGVAPDENGVRVRTACGASELFDDVVIATHSDQALGMLEAPTELEQKLLGAIRYQSNKAVLHSDARLMPTRRRAWASWNYLGSSRGDAPQMVTVTYWMNRLQSLPESLPLFVTLNPDRDVDERLTHRWFDFAHPVIDGAAGAAQRDLWSLQGRHGIWYCGAYFGAGFHEDGLQAGLAVAEAISGRRRPWQVAGQSSRIYIDQSQPSEPLKGVAA